jgi:hypothetical protein
MPEHRDWLTEQATDGEFKTLADFRAHLARSAAQIAFKADNDFYPRQAQYSRLDYKPTSDPTA